MKTQAITSKENPRIKHLAKLLRDKAFRYSQSEYVIEGRRAILDSKDVTELYICEGVSWPGSSTQKRYQVRKSVFEMISGTENSQGLVAVAALKLGDAQSILGNARYVVLDRLQDPGNMGTIIRTAAAFGIRGMIFLEGTVDPFSPKVVRSSAGSIGKLEMIRIDDYRDLKPFNIVAADMTGTKLSDFSWPDGFILAIGNEGSGLSEELSSLAASRVSIPISKNVESLNAAISAGILLYEATRE